MTAPSIKKLSLWIIAILALLPLVFGCGGGGGGGGGGSADGGIGGTGFTSVGEIAAKGSIFVNGVEFETEGARLEIEGQDPVTLGADDSALKLGQVVLVDGAVNPDGFTGTAERIVFEDNLEGPVTSVSETNPGLVKTLSVLGQTVVVENGATRLDGLSFDSLAVGQVLEVTGFEKVDGSLQATLVELKPAGGTFEIKGFIDSLAGSTFTINGLNVDISVATVEGSLSAGVLVEVKGDTFDGSTLQASSVEVRVAGLGVEDLDEAEIEGFIVNLNTPTKTFTLSGQPVSYAGAAFEGGLETDLADDLRVEVEGTVAGGILQAEKVEFKETVRIEANVATIDVSSGTLTLQGVAAQATGSALEVRVDPSLTEFDDGVGLGDLGTGNNLKIRARLSGSSPAVLVATRIDVEDPDPDTEVRLQGPVESFDETTGAVIVVGVLVDTTTIENNEFKDDDTVIGRAAFFDRLSIGDLVKARADLDLTTDELTWNQIEFED